MMQRGVVTSHPALAFGLRLVHRQISVAQENVAVVTGRADGVANARAHEDFLARYHERRCQGLEKTVAELLRTRVANILGEHRELVSAEASNRIDASHRTPNTPSDQSVPRRAQVGRATGRDWRGRSGDPRTPDAGAALRGRAAR